MSLDTAMDMYTMLTGDYVCYNHSSCTVVIMDKTCNIKERMTKNMFFEKLKEVNKNRIIK